MVALSSGEAECYAFVSGCIEGLFIRDALQHIGIECALEIHSGSRAARGIMSLEGVSEVRHLSARCLWLQQKVKEEELVLKVFGSNRNPADLRTEVLTRDRIDYLCNIAEVHLNGPGTGGEHKDRIVHK